jgi:hypothetical protein
MGNEVNKFLIGASGSVLAVSVSRRQPGTIHSGVHVYDSLHGTLDL